MPFQLTCERCGDGFTVGYPSQLKRRYCRLSCRDTRQTLPQALAILRATGITTESGCLVGKGRSSWYTRITVDGEEQYAHRLIWADAHGPIPDGMFVLHHCDNPPCYLDEHLFLGTHTDNMRDMLQKGRAGVWVHPERLARGAEHPSKTHPERVYRGAQHHARIYPAQRLPSGRAVTAKLTVQRVAVIRADRAAGWGAVALAAREGITKTQVSNIVARRCWKTVP